MKSAKPEDIRREVKIMNLSPEDKVASLALVSNENVDLSDLS